MDEHDHGDEPITLDEILDSIELNVVRVRIRGDRRRRLIVWSPEFHPHLEHPPPIHPDIPDWPL